MLHPPDKAVGIPVPPVDVESVRSVVTFYGFDLCRLVLAALERRVGDTGNRFVRMPHLAAPYSLQDFSGGEVDDASHPVVRTALACPGAYVDDARVCEQPFDIYLALPELRVDIVCEIPYHCAHVGLHVLGLGYLDTGRITAVESVVLGYDLGAPSCTCGVFGVDAVHHHVRAFLRQGRESGIIAEIVSGRPVVVVEIL